MGHLRDDIYRFFYNFVLHVQVDVFPLLEAHFTPQYGFAEGIIIIEMGQFLGTRHVGRDYPCTHGAVVDVVFSCKLDDGL